jgi:hypothetical protein
MEEETEELHARDVQNVTLPSNVPDNQVFVFFWLVA